VDTEFVRERTYYADLCLVQLATTDEVAIVDPLAIKDLAPLGELMADPQIVKVFHSGDQDLEILYQLFGAVPTPVFDTQVAAAFDGCPLQVGLAKLVERLCDVRLAKSESLTDWKARPLSPEQLEYAAADVIYLPAIYRTLKTHLGERGRLSWFADEQESLLDPARYQTDPYQIYKKINRHSSLYPNQLAVLREVAALRERIAQERNQPRKWVINDEQLMAMARKAPSDLDGLYRIRGLVNKIRPQMGERFLEAIRRGKQFDGKRLVESKQPDPKRLDKTVHSLMVVIQEQVAAKAQVAPELLARHGDLTRFAVAPGEPNPLAQGWRYELLGRHLRDLLEGRLTLRVHEGSLLIQHPDAAIGPTQDAE
jgi:ribonuclease D